MIKKIISVILLMSLIISSFTACAVRKLEDPETSAPETNSSSHSPNTPVTESPVTEPPATEPPATEPPVTEPPATEPPATEPPVTEPPVTEPPVTTKPIQEDYLFIGDSRTVGLQLYSGVDADYFANVGMSVFSIGNATVEIDGLGSITLNDLLKKKQYKRIFIMLGINEIGTPISSLVNKYSDLLDTVKQKQPDSYIFIQANLHVSNEFTQSSPHINNTALNDYNTELAKLADNKHIFYLDANHLFDDSTGQLSDEKSFDGVHYHAKEYIPWINWLLSQSASLIG